MIAIVNDNIEIINLLLDKGAKINYYNNIKCLPVIVTNYNKLSARTKKIINLRPFSPLSTACYKNNNNIINMLLDKGVTPSTDDIIFSVNSCSKEIIELLLIKLENDMKQEKNGNKIYFNRLDDALHQAISRDNYEILQFLINKGGNKIIKLVR